MLNTLYVVLGVYALLMGIYAATHPNSQTWIEIIMGFLFGWLCLPLLWLLSWWSKRYHAKKAANYEDFRR